MRDWLTKAINDVITKTQTVDPKKTPDDSFLYVDVSSVSNKTFEITNADKVRGKDAPSRARRIISKGDVIFATVRPTLRRIALVPEHLDGEVCSTGYFVFQPKPEVYNRFLYYFLQTNKFMGKMEKLQSGASYPAVNDSQIKSQLISYPPIQEQKRIVDILDQTFADIDKARANAEQNLKNARELFESYLEQVFSQRGEGWATSKLKDITSKIGSGATPRGGREAYKEVGISLIRSMNVHDRYFKRKDLAFIDDKQAGKLSNVTVQNNDVLLNITGASVARCCVVPDEFLPARVNQHVSIIRVDRTIIKPEFLNFVLTSKYYKDQLLGIGESGSTRQAITKAQIEEFEVDYPKNLNDQEELLNRLHTLEKQTNDLSNIYSDKLLALDELKKSILQKAFSGELTRTVKKAESNLIPFPTKLANIGTTDLHAGILALAYQAHEKAAKQQQFGHVKAEKIAHLAEAMLGIELDRTPIQDAAGPNDYPHFKKKVEPRAKKAGFFSFKGNKETGYILQKGHSFDAIADKARQALSDAGYLESFENMMQLLVKMDTAKAEIFATVYAAWNNLLLDNADISDEAIVQAARENWHDSKLKIPRERFFKAIAWVREENIVPLGRGKYVHANGERQ